MSTELVKETNRYETAFRQARHDPGVNEPAWLQNLRENSFIEFERAGFPDIKQEEWKYTNVTPIAKADEGLKRFIYEEVRQSTLVFVNGMLRRELSSLAALPDGVLVLDLREALRGGEYESTLREYLEHPALANGFAALNTALFTSGLFLKIPRGVNVETPIHLLFMGETRAENPPPAGFPRVLIVAEENSSATIVESYASPKDNAVYLTGWNITRSNAKAWAHFMSRLPGPS